MSDAKKDKQISQRWEENFQKEVKRAAAIFGTSMTKLTIEALEIYLSLSENEKFVNMHSKQRKELIISTLKDQFDNMEELDSKVEEINTDGLDEIGLIRDQVEQLLRKNPDHQFSTNDISDVLNIPQSTARTYVRQISEENNGNFVLVRGRPNKIYYSSTY